MAEQGAENPGASSGFSGAELGQDMIGAAGEAVKQAEAARDAEHAAQAARPLAEGAITEVPSQDELLAAKDPEKVVTDFEGNVVG